MVERNSFNRLLIPRLACFGNSNDEISTSLEKLKTIARSQHDLPHNYNVQGDKLEGLIRINNQIRIKN